IRRAANLDLGFACVGGRREMGTYIDALKAAGKDPARYSLVNSRVVYLADSEEQAWRDTSEALLYQAEHYARWLSAAAGTDPSRAMIRPDPDRLKRTSILGPPDYVRARISEIVNDTPMTELVMVTQLPGLDPAKAYRSLERFGTEVLPSLKVE
ncbi:MAG: hypothetical protein WA005_02330, partial [Candidatus Binataceae bacterium]